MKFSFSIEKWSAHSAGLSNDIDWISWSKTESHDWTLPLPSQTKLPMMQARRMSTPSRLAVNVGLTLINEEHIDFAIFISRHGELERTHKILVTLNENKDISPTDFALSVHNTASGLLTIIAKKMIPITSISASQDGFQQSLIEATALLNEGYKRILLIDFDGEFPNMYQTKTRCLVPAYAVGFIITKGDAITVETTHKNYDSYQNNLPQSLAFLHGYLSKKPLFTLQGLSQSWLWTINNVC